MAGGLSYNDAGSVVGMEAWVLHLRLRDRGLGGTDQVSAGWEITYSTFVRGTRYPGLNALPFTVASRQQEVDDAIEKDAYLLAVGYGILFAYVTAVFSRSRLVRSHGSMSVAAFVSTCKWALKHVASAPLHSFF